jgi:hypothetical protein
VNDLTLLEIKLLDTLQKFTVELEPETIRVRLAWRVKESALEHRMHKMMVRQRRAAFRVKKYGANK